MALSNDDKTKKKIYDLMYENCLLENESFTYFKIVPYYENKQWFVEVGYGLKKEVYKVIEDDTDINFKLINFEVY